MAKRHVPLRAVHLVAFEDADAREADLRARVGLGDLGIDLLQPRERLPFAGRFGRVAARDDAEVTHRAAVADEIGRFFFHRPGLRVQRDQVGPGRMKLCRIREIMAETRGEQVGVLEDLSHFGRSRRVGGRGRRLHLRFDFVAQLVEEPFELDAAPVASQNGRVLVDPPQTGLQLPRLDVLQPFPLQGPCLEFAEDIAEVLGLALQVIGDLVEDAFDLVGRSRFDDDHHLGGLLKGRRILFPMFMELGLRVEELGTVGLELEEKERVAGAGARGEDHNRHDKSRPAGRDAS